MGADEPAAQGNLRVSLRPSRTLHLQRQTVSGRTVCLNWASTGLWGSRWATTGSTRKVRPVEGISCSAALKSEDRRPKPERRPKSEFREWPKPTSCCSDGVAINSDLGLRSSGLGFGVARTDFRAALLVGPRRDAGSLVQESGVHDLFRHALQELVKLNRLLSREAGFREKQVIMRNFFREGILVFADAGGDVVVFAG